MNLCYNDVNFGWYDKFELKVVIKVLYSSFRMPCESRSVFCTAKRILVSV